MNGFQLGRSQHESRVIPDSRLSSLGGDGGLVRTEADGEMGLEDFTQKNRARKVEILGKCRE